MSNRGLPGKFTLAGICGFLLFAMVSPLLVRTTLARTPQDTAQSAPAAASDQRPKFDVASVKPCERGNLLPPSPPSADGGSGRGGSGAPVNPVQWAPGRLTLTCLSVRSLIASAFSDNVFSASITPIEGLPDWTSCCVRPDSQRFTIIAEAPVDVSKEMMMGPMMQSLLEDRFNLKVHREIRDVPAYELHVAKGGPKLPEPDDAVCRGMDANHVRVGPESLPDCNLAFQKISMANFAAGLSGPPVGELVIDKTGLEGTFTIHILFSRDPASDLPTIFEALKEQLGLELVPAKGTEKALVVDHIEEPTPN